ncbi:hypothetical protein LWI28_018741 [Acer negundo]|uniref:RING-type domain-containing protein n=1 Tax=Acer negundo TaxID=4023 RepID=A0AAD5J686_ACENE|nr:hypothetical protein LWI28_018741 [Acer negundo]KAK4852212.1 hypothetical protein QYF36_022027 [Acer negundo]
MIMVPQVPFVSLPADIPLLFTLMTALCIVIVILFCVKAVCMIAISFITIIIYVICNYVFWLCFDRYERDIDQLGRVTPQSRMIITRRDNVFGGEAFRKQVEKMSPPLVFRSKKTLFSFRDCSICLDDYKEGDFCRVFPFCNHMFHLKCIDLWLKNRLTCPICRKRLSDA